MAQDACAGRGSSEVPGLGGSGLRSSGARWPSGPSRWFSPPRTAPRAKPTSWPVSGSAASGAPADGIAPAHHPPAGCVLPLPEALACRVQVSVRRIGAIGRPFLIPTDRTTPVPRCANPGKPIPLVPPASPVHPRSPAGGRRAQNGRSVLARPPREDFSAAARSMSSSDSAGSISLSRLRTVRIFSGFVMARDRQAHRRGGRARTLPAGRRLRPGQPPAGRALIEPGRLGPATADLPDRRGPSPGRPLGRLRRAVRPIFEGFPASSGRSKPNGTPLECRLNPSLSASSAS